MTGGWTGSFVKLEALLAQPVAEENRVATA